MNYWGKAKHKCRKNIKFQFMSLPSDILILSQLSCSLLKHFTRYGFIANTTEFSFIFCPLVPHTWSSINYPNSVSLVGLARILAVCTDSDGFASAFRIGSRYRRGCGVVFSRVSMVCPALLFLFKPLMSWYTKRWLRGDHQFLRFILPSEGFIAVWWCGSVWCDRTAGW